jgi:probable rRNA maturation factor
MKLSVTRHERCAGKKIPWLGRSTIGRLERAARSAGRGGGGVDLVVVDDAFIRELNRRYRGIDRPTDVLSFSYDGDGEERAAIAGEVYVSHETVARDAHASAVPPENLFLRVGVHGVLHVIGFDHEKSADARRMEAEEKRILLEQLTETEVEELF